MPVNTYLIYARDVFLGKAKGRDEAAAIKRFVDDCGFDSIEEYAQECFAEPSDIRAKMAGIWA